MKKFILLSVISFISLSVFAQTTTKKTLAEKSFSMNTFQITHKLSITEGDTSQYVVVVYRDGQFSQLEKYRSLMFSSQEEVNAFKQNIIDISTASLNKEDTRVTINKDAYFTTTKGSTVYLYGEHSSYFSLSKGMRNKVVQFLETIHFE